MSLNVLILHLPEKLNNVREGDGGMEGVVTVTPQTGYRSEQTSGVGSNPVRWVSSVCVGVQSWITVAG